jgi:ATP-dependent helicase/nuclease subunit A
MTEGKRSTENGSAGPVAPVDRDARERIRTDLNTTFLVEAGAGSGKTQSLVERMIALIASGRTTIQGLAAVTFTRKAAAELRSRFQVALESCLGPDSVKWTGQERARLGTALRNLEQGFVGTIHSFCVGLLRERPVEAGIDPEFREMEELEDGVFREKCWEEYLARVRLGDEPILRSLEEVGLDPGDLKDAFAKVILYPEVKPVSGGAAPPDFGAIRRKLERFLDSAAEVVPAERPMKGYDDLQRLIGRTLLRRRNLGLSDDRDLMSTLEILDRTPRVTRNRWRSKEEAEAFEAAFGNFLGVVVRPALRAWREWRHPRVLAFLQSAAAFYDERRRAESRLNFQDQLMLVSRLLRDNPEVRRSFQGQFGCILVDEFQDTDPIQAEILFELTGQDPEECDWTRIVPAPGSLFLVGDPKQSIYRFRRADIDIYNLVKERIRDGGGAILELTSNFRSLGRLAEWINPAFEEAFPAAADGYQAGFAPLQTVREGCPRAASGIFRASVPAVKYHREKAIAGLDAARLAEFISQAVSGGLEISAGEDGVRAAVPGDFLVLFRYKKNMNIYARELEVRGVPFEIGGSDAFAASEEIGEIVNLLLALRDPGNPVAVVAALRGLFFGASDQELLDFRMAGGEFVASEPPAAGPPAGKIGLALRTLRDWREWTTKFPPTAVLEMILEASGLINHLVSSEMGSSRAGNVLKLVEVVRDLEAEGMTSFGAVVDYIREWVEVQAVEEMSLTPGRRNAVRLMNLHKAKGLEAPVVILANPIGVAGHEPGKHIVRVGGTGRGTASSREPAPPGPLGYFLFGKKSGWQETLISQPEGWDEKALEEKKYEEAEEARLMYVASTRARDMLVVSAYEGDLSGRRAWHILESRLDGVPELERPPAAAAVPRARGRLILKPDEVRRGRLGIMAARGAASTASYLLESVTSLAKGERASPAWAAGGFGLKWGTAVHVLLSSLGKAWSGGGPDGAAGLPERAFRLLAANALESAGLASGQEESLLSLVRGILSSKFWARAMAAERRFFETPFSIRLEAGDPEWTRLAARPGFVSAAGGKPVAAAAGAPLFVSGAIDLAFLEKDGWVIADYKTDRIAEAGPNAGEPKKAFVELIDYYRPQVELYGRFWEKITGRRVKESGLYFTSLPAWVRIG